MAEAAAIIGLVASIASLIELSAKVVSRLHEFTSEASEIPESFRSLLIRLPLLTATLQCIQIQAEAGRLPDDVTNALKAVVGNTSEQVSAVQTYLSKIPPNSTSKLERALKALKSLAKEDKVLQALEKIHKNNDVLVLHQTTRHVDTGDRILEELSKLSLAPPALSKSSGVRELLSVARDIEKTIIERHTLQAQSVLVNSNNGILLRFSQLPIIVQENFIAKQQEQLKEFVEQEEVKFLHLLNRFDTRDRLRAASEPRAAGTCEWVLKKHSYLEWVQGRCNRLWLHGHPGAGKTVVSAFITEVLHKGLGDQEVLAVYACSFIEPQTTPAISILCSLAGQIAESSPASMDKYKRFLEKTSSEHQLQARAQDLQDLIVEMSLSADLQRIFIIIDGLDEYRWEQLDDLMAIIDIPRYSRKVKMLITSRLEAKIVEALHDYSPFSLEPESLNADIAAFIDREFESGKLADMTQHDFDQIRHKLISMSDGCFLWVRMVIEQFRPGQSTFTKKLARLLPLDVA